MIEGGYRVLTANSRLLTCRKIYKQTKTSNKKNNAYRHLKVYMLDEMTKIILRLGNKLYHSDSSAFYRILIASVLTKI